MRKNLLPLLLALAVLVPGLHASAQAAQASPQTTPEVQVSPAVPEAAASPQPQASPDAQGTSERMLRISEVMASNRQTLEDAFGREPDWIELHNTTDSAISLKGVCLSDDKDKLDRYQFPDTAVIEPGQYLIVFASGAKKNIADEYHTPFKLSAAGEAVYLSRGGVVLDEVLFEDQRPDISLALDKNDTYQLTSTPTPGSENVITKV